MSEHIERTLDWKIRKDPASLNYKISRTLGVRTDIPPRKRTWSRAVVLDQGSEGACTGFGMAHTLLSTPYAFRWPSIDYTFAFTLYKEAQKRDEWPGENYEGSSVLGAMLAARDAGYLNKFLWATTMAEIDSALSFYGPMLIGVNWYEGMWNTDSNGFVHVSGEFVGGHALELIGNDPPNRRYELGNSWGPDWGIKGGRAYISYEDLDTLRRMQGEFALPRKNTKIIRSGN